MAEHRGPNRHRRRSGRNIELEEREALSPATAAVIGWVGRDAGGTGAACGRSPLSTGARCVRTERTLHHTARTTRCADRCGGEGETMTEQPFGKSYSGSAPENYERY